MPGAVVGMPTALMASYPQQPILLRLADSRPFNYMIRVVASPLTKMRFPGLDVKQVKSQEALPEFSFLSDDGFPLAARGRGCSHTSLGFSRTDKDAEENPDFKLRTLKHEYLSYEGIPICARKPVSQNSNVGRERAEILSLSERTVKDLEGKLAAINRQVFETLENRVHLHPRYHTDC